MRSIGVLAGVWLMAMGAYGMAHAEPSPEGPAGHWMSHPGGRRVGGALTSPLGWCGETDAMRKQYHFWRGDDGLDAWDVDGLVARAAGLPVEQIQLAEIDEIDSVYWFDGSEHPTVRNVVEHFRLIQEVDTSYPIIVGPDGRVLDGMHRIARALLEGRGSIAAVRLPVLPAPDYKHCQPDDLPY